MAWQEHLSPYRRPLRNMHPVAGECAVIFRPLPRHCEARCARCREFNSSQYCLIERVHIAEDLGKPTMAVKCKSALKSIAPSGIATLREGLNTQLPPSGTVLMEELAALLPSVLDDGNPASGCWPSVVAVMPASGAPLHSASIGRTCAPDEHGTTDCAARGVRCRKNASVQRTASSPYEQRTRHWLQRDKGNGDWFGGESW